MFGIREGLIGIACLESEMGKASKNAWLKEFKEINKTIRAENARLRRLLQEADTTLVTDHGRGLSKVEK